MTMPTAGAARDEEAVALHATLRFAAGVTCAFVLGESLQWTPTFLAAVLSAALLGNLPTRPPLKLGLVLVLVMALSALYAFVLTSFFLGMPVVLFGLVALTLLLALHAIHRGKQMLPPLLLMICVATIPVVGLAAPAYGDVLPKALVRGMVVAMAMVWCAFALWPRAMAQAPVPATASATPVVTALLSTAVVMPVLLAYLLFGLSDVLPVLVATTMIVANFDPRSGGKQAVGLIVGNFAGGLLGLLIHAALTTTPSLAFLALLLFLATLGFGQRIAAGGPMKPVAVIACNAMLIILGSAIASGPSSLSLWLVRLFQFALAGAFAVGMMSLVWHRATLRRLLPGG